MRQKRESVAFIGGGNMATALIRGLLASGARASSLVVSEPVASRRASLKRRFKVRATADNGEAARDAATVVIAVKPQVIDDALASIREHVDGAQLVLSIAAGVRIGRIESALGRRARVVRAMPNTPCLVGRGATVICGGSRSRRADLAAVAKIFRAVGDAHVVADERWMDAVTALSGSGPAYIYRFAEALVQAGLRCGLPEPLASALTYQTLAGAAEMLLRTGETPEALRTAVSSPGGTTLAGLAAMDGRGFFDSVIAGVEAAKRRSEELAASPASR
jgi:pyrroline-5-carboxylate reductase